MKKLIFILWVICALIGCTKKPVQHESPKFLAVVDSICNEEPYKGGYHGPTVIMKFHDYMNSCTADKNPIFKDLPFTVNSVSFYDDKDSTKVASLSLIYTYEEESGNTKRLYKLFVDAESKFGMNESVDIKKGQKYFIKPDALIPYYSYENSYDTASVGEGRDGGRVDVRIFGTVEIDNVKLIPAE